MIYNVFIGIGVLAILVVFIAENVWQRKHQKKIYHLADTITNTACGISDRVFNIFFDTVQFIIWTRLYSHVALLQLPFTFLNWVLCLVVVDFIWYWYHRLGHEVRLFWSIHNLHHQSEEFNISVGFRISIFQSILRGFFWLLLPLAGFQPEMILGVLVFHGLYQLPLHTRLTKRIPILDLIFVTPSYHRVHHGMNEPYLDKNYGGVFIIWDRMFGTFANETEEVKFGLTDQPGPLGFVQSHIYGFKQLTVPGNAKLNFSQRMRYLFSKPSWLPEGIEKPKSEVANFEVAPELSKYVFIQIVMSAVITVVFIFNRENWNANVKVLQVLLICWTLASATLRYNSIKTSVIVHELLRNTFITACYILLSIDYSIPWYYGIPVYIFTLFSLLLLPYKKGNS